MPGLTKRGARHVSTDLDRIADLIQSEHAVLGIPPKIAVDFAYRCDLLSDAIERMAIANAKLSEAEGDGAKDGDGEEDKKAEDETEDKEDKEDEKKEVSDKTAQFDASTINDVKPGPLQADADEPYMRDSFTQQDSVQLTEKQESGDLERRMEQGVADPKLASERVEQALKRLTRLAAVGKFSSQQADYMIEQLVGLEGQLDEVSISIATLADVVLKRKGASIEDAYKKTIGEIKSSIPSSFDSQRSALTDARKGIIAYVKRMEARPTVTPVDTDAPNLDVVEARMSQTISREVERVSAAIAEEMAAVSQLAASLKYEVQDSAALDTTLKLRDWITANLPKITRLLGLGAETVKAAAGNVVKALDAAEKQIDDVLKSASVKTAGDVPEAFKKQWDKNKKDDAEDDDKKDDDDNEKDGKAASSHGYNLFA